jgi:hypothetical protein
MGRFLCSLVVSCQCRCPLPCSTLRPQLMMGHCSPGYGIGDLLVDCLRTREDVKCAAVLMAIKSLRGTSVEVTRK